MGAKEVIKRAEESQITTQNKIRKMEKKVQKEINITVVDANCVVDFTPANTFVQNMVTNITKAIYDFLPHIEEGRQELYDSRRLLLDMYKVREHFSHYNQTDFTTLSIAQLNNMGYQLTSIGSPLYKGGDNTDEQLGFFCTVMPKEENIIE